LETEYDANDSDSLSSLDGLFSWTIFFSDSLHWVPAVIQFFVFFFLFLARFSLWSSFFSKSRFKTRPLFCVFQRKKLGWLANPTFLAGVPV
jgi:hypothetical protein